MRTCRLVSGFVVLRSLSNIELVNGLDARLAYLRTSRRSHWCFADSRVLAGRQWSVIAAVEQAERRGLGASGTTRPGPQRGPDARHLLRHWTSSSPNGFPVPEMLVAMLVKEDSRPAVREPLNWQVSACFSASGPNWR